MKDAEKEMENESEINVFIIRSIADLKALKKAKDKGEKEPYTVSKMKKYKGGR